MLPLFRRIRKKMAYDDKPLKYMRYAIGEIILVVIGILIALSINNWNEQNKNEELELFYYSRVLDDIELDKKLVKDLLEKADKRIEISKTMILDLDSGTKDKNYQLNMFLQATRSNVFVPRNVAFKDLTSSGNIKLLNDIPLKNSLIQYYSNLEDKLAQLKQAREIMMKRSFEMGSPSDFGIYEFDYISKSLGPEILRILPNVDWTKDKNNENYKNFLDILISNVGINERTKQHLMEINRMMEVPYQLLLEKCKDLS